MEKNFIRNVWIILFLRVDKTAKFTDEFLAPNKRVRRSEEKLQ
jgi:hypothetical protein